MASKLRGNHFYIPAPPSVQRRAVCFMENTSLSLLTRVREAGDPLAWSRLVEIYTPLLQRWCQTYDVQAADADDVIQEVLAAVVSELPEFQHNQRTGAFRAWLRLMLVNRLRRFWRTRDAAPNAAGHVDQLEQIARTMGAKRIVRPAWSDDKK